jgi:peptidoglycan/LPS O-acetylase OafA/YrhL
MRFDIQLLRGVAVLLVVLFHARDSIFSKGYLGVDIFFVISGFLITGMIMRDIDAQRFSFLSFYARRARRLLPATISTLALTAILAFALLTSSQMKAFGAQLLGALTFSANVVLAMQSGYFDSVAETKPLLHMWSLSLEEQFYFIAPVLLLFTPRKFRLGLLVAALVLSLALCLLLMTGPTWLPVTAAASQKLAFFMLPARAWELLAGSIVSWIMVRHPILTLPNFVKFSALASIVLVCIIGFDPLHPRGDAILVVIATCLLLLGKDDWMPSTILTRPLARIGDWSYSLYLVHWPLFSLAFVAYLSQPPALVMAGLVLAALALAWLQYTFVEQPFRHRQTQYPFHKWGAVAAAALMLAFVSTQAMSIQPRFDIASTHGLNIACDQNVGPWKDLPECRTASRPLIAIWGDSYAMHYVPGLIKLPLVQMTRSACAPIVGAANVSGPYTETWASGCAKFSDDVVAAIEGMPSVKFVLISSPFSQVFRNSGQSLLIDGRLQAWSHAGADHFKSTLVHLKKAGKVPVVIAPTPSADFDAGACNERMLERKLLLGRRDCGFPIDRAARAQDVVVKTLHRIGLVTGVSILDPADAYCSGVYCKTKIGNLILYADAGHLTKAGSQFVAKALGLRDLVGPPGRGLAEAEALPGL